MFDKNSLRVLISLGSAPDTISSERAINLSGFTALICRKNEDLVREIRRGVGALLLSRCVLSEKNLPELLNALSNQPVWSHLPVIILDREGEVLTSRDPSLQQLEPLVSINLLEGNVRLSNLLSAVRASIAYRRRQYQQRDLLCELDQSRREAIEANRAKSDFLANMSHEIRTPLGAVLGFSELLMDAEVSEVERQMFIGTIRRNGQLLSVLINDILDLAKVESGRIGIEMTEFQLPELISELLSILEPQAARKSLKLVIQADGVPAAMRTDPIRLKQILSNVIGNAVKFTNQGSVRVRFSVRPTSGNDAELRVEVEDTGIGISDEQARRLFQPFTQADGSMTRRFGGTGLGLVLSRKLAHALGGELDLKWSIFGHGSCFMLGLPVELAGRAANRRTLVQRPADG